MLQPIGKWSKWKCVLIKEYACYPFVISLSFLLEKNIADEICILYKHWFQVAAGKKAINSY